MSGRQLFRAGAYSKALDRLRQASELLPDDPRPRYHAALAHHVLGDLDRARRLARGALAVGARLRPVERKRLTLLLSQGQGQVL